MMDNIEEYRRSKAYVTMLSDDSFIAGVQVLSKSLQATGTQYPFFVMTGPGVSKTVMSRLKTVSTGVIPVTSIENTNDGHEASWRNSEFLKLNIWNLTIFEQIVYLDADTLVLESIDDLFDRDCTLAAAPDVFPPDKFNAGVLMIRPDNSVFADMMSKVGELASYDGGDTDWYTRDSCSRLPFGYNAQRTLFWFTHDKCPGYWNSIQPLKVIHYSSSPKPWEVEMSQVKIGDLEWLWWRQFMGF